MPAWIAWFTPQICQALISTGGGLLIAMAILVGLYRLADEHGQAFVQAQRAQAEALGRQAASMEGLQQTVQDFVRRDNSEHREILILQKLTIEKMKGLEDSLNGREKGKV